MIKLTNINKKYDLGDTQVSALKDVSLTIGRGEYIAIMGPSGSGKSTLMHILGILDSISSGQYFLEEYDISSLPDKEQARIRNQHFGFIFQSFNLLPVYNVFENVELSLLLLKTSAAERKKAVNDALEWVGLQDMAKKKPPQLSGGESQRVAIARAIVKRPNIVLADEPTANLDAGNAHVIMQTMQKLNAELDTTFIFATHDEKVMKYLNRMIHLQDGSVAKDEILESKTAQP